MEQSSNQSLCVTAGTKRQSICKFELEIEIQCAVRHREGPVSAGDTGCAMAGELWVRKSVREGKIQLLTCVLMCNNSKQK